MKKISAISAIGLIIILAGSGCDREAKDSRPNILILLCDDLRWDALGCMGNRFVITPHIDRMAGESVVFRNVFHTSPICKPSRSTIMLGQYLGTHGSGFDPPTDFNITDREFDQSYPVILKKAGYFTGFIGKFGFAAGGEEKISAGQLENRQEYMPAGSFDRWYGFPGQGSYRPEKNGSFNGHENPGRAGHLTEWMGQQAIRFISEASEAGRPFCLSVSFKAPHAPFDPDPRFRMLYDSLVIPRMVNDTPDAHESLPGAVRERSRNADWYFGRSDPYRASWHIELDHVYLEFIRNYYALVTGIDHAVGQIRQGLENTGAENNTVIIFTSDNGFFCGSRQLMGKSLLYDESAKAPMIVFDPRTSKDERGRGEKGLISMVDVAPTILDLAGLPALLSMQGISFLPILENEVEAIRDVVFGENNFDNHLPLIVEVEDPMHYFSIRSKYTRTLDYKYIRYHECNPVAEELWDMRDDPLESVNRINDPAYSEVALELRARLDSFEARYVLYSNTSKKMGQWAPLR